MPFAPRVFREAAPGWGMALANGADHFFAARRRSQEDEARKREEERQRIADDRATQSFALQLESAQRANRMGQRQEQLQPVLERSQMRGLGYVPNAEADRDRALTAAAATGAMLTPGGTARPATQYGEQVGDYTLRPDLTPEALARAAKELENSRRMSELQYREQQNNARAHDANVTRLRAAGISRDATIGAARIRSDTDKAAGLGVGYLGKMTPEGRRRHFTALAEQQIAAADSELPSDTPQRDTEVMKKAMKLIVDDPDTKDYFSYGMDVSHVRDAMRRYKERPAARAGAGDEAERALMQRLAGGAAAATPPATVPARQVAPAPAPAAAPAATPARKQGESDADYWESLVGAGVPKDRATAIVRGGA